MRRTQAHPDVVNAHHVGGRRKVEGEVALLVDLVPCFEVLRRRRIALARIDPQLHVNAIARHEPRLAIADEDEPIVLARFETQRREDEGQLLAVRLRPRRLVDGLVKERVAARAIEDELMLSSDGLTR